MQAFNTSLHCIAAIYGDLMYDSRAKRAFSYLRKSCHVNCFHSGTNYYFDEKFYSSGASSLFSFVFLILQTIFSSRVTHLYIIGLPTLILLTPIAFIFRKKIIYDSREIYLLDEFGESTYSSKHRLLELLCSYFVWGIIAANEERMLKIKEKYRWIKYFSYIQNIPATEFNLGHKKLSDITRIVYQGEIGKNRGFEKFLRSIELVKAKILVIFIIPQRERDYLLDFLQDFRVNYEILDFMPHNELLTYISKCDIGFVGYELIGLNNRLCEPNKLYEYAQSRLKIISTPQKKFIDVFSNYEIGGAFTLVDWNESNFIKMASTIEDIIKMDSKPKEFDRFNRDFNAKNELSRLQSFFKFDVS